MRTFVTIAALFLSAVSYAQIALPAPAPAPAPVVAPAPVPAPAVTAPAVTAPAPSVAATPAIPPKAPPTLEERVAALEQAVQLIANNAVSIDAYRGLARDLVSVYDEVVAIKRAMIPAPKTAPKPAAPRK